MADREQSHMGKCKETENDWNYDASSLLLFAALN